MKRRQVQFVKGPAEIAPALEPDRATPSADVVRACGETASASYETVTDIIRHADALTYDPNGDHRAAARASLGSGAAKLQRLRDDPSGLTQILTAMLAMVERTRIRPSAAESAVLVEQGRNAIEAAEIDADARQELGLKIVGSPGVALSDHDFAAFIDHAVAELSKLTEPVEQAVMRSKILRAAALRRKPLSAQHATGLIEGSLDASRSSDLPAHTKAIEIDSLVKARDAGVLGFTYSQRFALEISGIAIARDEHVDGTTRAAAICTVLRHLEADVKPAGIFEHLLLPNALAALRVTGTDLMAQVRLAEMLGSARSRAMRGVPSQEEHELAGMWLRLSTDKRVPPAHRIRLASFLFSALGRKTIRIGQEASASLMTRLAKTLQQEKQHVQEKIELLSSLFRASRVQAVSFPPELATRFTMYAATLCKVNSASYAARAQLLRALVHAVMTGKCDEHAIPLSEIVEQVFDFLKRDTRHPQERARVVLELATCSARDRSACLPEQRERIVQLCKDYSQHASVAPGIQAQLMGYTSSV